MSTKKITKATLKSFIRKNNGKLWVRCESNFDGMIDGISYNHGAQFQPAVKDEGYQSGNSLGIAGVWLVGGSGNYFCRFDEDGFEGINVWNCCGSSTIAIKKEGKSDASCI